MNVIALTIGDETVASTHYRLGQFVVMLETRGVSLSIVQVKRFDDWVSLEKYDLVILQKRLLRPSLIRRIRKRAKHFIFDTDDAIWEPHGREHSWWTRFRTDRRLRAVTAAADACTVPNEHLAQALRPLAKQLHLIPMALDENHWKPSAERSPGPIRIGWSGAPPNLAYLIELGETLEEVQAARPDSELIIYCGKVPAWNHRVKFVHQSFQPGTEASVVETFDIGLLPLPDNRFAAGKSPIKALQYAACGIPCIASPIGATTEIVQHEKTGLLAGNRNEWREALIRLIDNQQERKRLGNEARRQFLAGHSRGHVLTSMVATWKATVGRP